MRHAMGRLKKAIFLDKDGTLVINVPYSVDLRKIVFSPGAVRGLRMFAAAGYHLLLASNQSGVARGYYTEKDLERVRARIASMMDEAGVTLLDFYYCPHFPDGVDARYARLCNCRKPEPGLILRAAKEHAIDLNRSWVIGDILDDVEAGHRAGCKSVLIDNGNETEWKLSPERLPDYTALDLTEAAFLVLTGDRPFKTIGVSPLLE